MQPLTLSATVLWFVLIPPFSLPAQQRHLTDGKVTLVLTPWKIEHYHDAEHRGPGLDHVGFKVESVETFKRDFEILTTVDPELMLPKAPNATGEHNVVLRLLEACRYGKLQLFDPDGNFIDLSEY